MTLNNVIRTDFMDMLDADDRFSTKNVALKTGIPLVTLVAWLNKRIDLSKNNLFLIEDCMQEWKRFNSRH
nr:MAG TPA: Regulatory protein-modification, helix-turn-helix, transcriptional regulator, DNA [Bacteriophage sp.]